MIIVSTEGMLILGHMEVMVIDFQYHTDLFTSVKHLLPDFSLERIGL